jgi:hypothetical protein
MLIGHHGYCGCDSGVILIESRGNGAPTQECPFRSLLAGDLPVCVQSRLLVMCILLLLFLSLNSKGVLWVAGVVPRQL